MSRFINGTCNDYIQPNPAYYKGYEWYKVEITRQYYFPGVRVRIRVGTLINVNRENWGLVSPRYGTIKNHICLIFAELRRQW